MKNKKNLISIILLFALIFLNIFLEFQNNDFSSNPNDDKKIKQSNKYELETDDNKVQNINDCFEKYYKYSTAGNSEIINYISSSSKPNVDDFSIQKIYKFEKENKGIYYVEMYELSQETLSKTYYVVKLDYDNHKFFISSSNSIEFENAKRNKADKNLNFTIKTNPNADEEDTTYSFVYNDNSIKIANRYVNDFYIKYNYSKKEAKELTKSIEKIKSLEKIYESNITSFKKNINNNYITYLIITNNKEYEINVYSPFNYNIEIR